MKIKGLFIVMIACAVACLLLTGCKNGKNGKGATENTDSIALCEESNILAPVCINGKWGYIDKNGKYIINPQFGKAGNFHGGLAAVCIYSNDGYYGGGAKWGFINPEGEYVVNPQFDEVHRFQEGAAAVKQGGKWGFIDESGNYIARPQFDKVENFSEGLAKVYVGGRMDLFEETSGRWGFIDKTGNYVINPQFDDVGSFHNVMDE